MPNGASQKSPVRLLKSFIRSAAEAQGFQIESIKISQPINNRTIVDNVLVQLDRKLKLSPGSEKFPFLPLCHKFDAAFGGVCVLTRDKKTRKAQIDIDLEPLGNEIIAAIQNAQQISTGP